MGPQIEAGVGANFAGPILVMTPLVAPLQNKRALLCVCTMPAPRILSFEVSKITGFIELVLLLCTIICYTSGLLGVAKA